MSLQRKNIQRKLRKTRRVRSKILSRTNGLARISVFRSASHIYGQLIDDVAQKTLASCSTLNEKNIKGDKKAVAYAIGLELAKRSLEKGIKEIVFDRGSFLYHGRVQSFAEGLRAGGLVF